MVLPLGGEICATMLTLAGWTLREIADTGTVSFAASFWRKLEVSNVSIDPATRHESEMTRRYTMPGMVGGHGGDEGGGGDGGGDGGDDGDGGKGGRDGGREGG